MPEQKKSDPKTNGHADNKKRENNLDETDEESFPASDAPAWTNHDQPPKKPQ